MPLANIPAMNTNAAGQRTAPPDTARLAVQPPAMPPPTSVRKDPANATSHRRATLEPKTSAHWRSGSVRIRRSPESTADENAPKRPPTRTRTSHVTPVGTMYLQYIEPGASGRPTYPERCWYAPAPLSRCPKTPIDTVTTTPRATPAT